MKNIFKSIALVALIAGMTSCKDKANTETVVTDTPEPQQEQVAEATEFEVEINSDDMMKFDKAEIIVPVGTKIILTLNHTGKMAKNVMGHNFVVLNQGVDMQAYAQKAQVATDEEYVPASEAASVLAHTKLIGGGESDTIEFTVEEAGAYDFLCSFPGHYGMMKGKLIAE